MKIYEILCIDPIVGTYVYDGVIMVLDPRILVFLLVNTMVQTNIRKSISIDLKPFECHQTK